MKIFKKLLIPVVGLYLIGCEDIIEIDLDITEPRLVIDASIDWVKNTQGNEQKIVLSTTTGYYSNDFPTVSGATVTVANTTATVFDFIETLDTGEYTSSDFEPVIGETYTLTIELDGEIYTATEILIPAPDIEDTIEQNDTGGFGSDEVEITYYYQDDGARINYYLFGITNSHVAFSQYSVEDDENNQGSLTPVYYSHKDLEPGDVLNIKLYGISRRYYEYTNKVLLASGNDDRPFPTTPTEVRGNIVNQTKGENYTYGYFRLSEVDSRDYTIK